MKIRLDDVMQSFSYPFEAAYYYYIPLETVLMFVGGVIFGKAVHGIATEKDVEMHSEDFIRLPGIGSEGRTKVMKSFVAALPDAERRKRLEPAAEDGDMQYFEMAVREEKLLMPWYNYRDDVYREFSRLWCEENGLELIG